MKNSICEVVSLPNEANVITEKQYFQLKNNLFRHILKYKTRWVAHGYKQEKAHNFIKTFAPVVKPMSYKYLFAMGFKRGY